MADPEFELRRADLTETIRKLVANKPPVGEAKRRELGLDTPSSSVKEWISQLPQDELFTRMLLEGSARVVITSSETYRKEPGLKFWAEPINYPAYQKVSLTLHYTGTGSSGDRQYILSMQDGLEPSLELRGKIDSDTFGSSILNAQQVEVGRDDLSSIRRILISTGQEAGILTR